MIGISQIESCHPPSLTIPHKLRAVLGGLGLNSVGQEAESLKHTRNVSAVLHGDDAAVVLLVHPAQRGLGLVVEDACKERTERCVVGTRLRDGRR